MGGARPGPAPPICQLCHLCQLCQPCQRCQPCQLCQSKSVQGIYSYTSTIYNLHKTYAIKPRDYTLNHVTIRAPPSLSPESVRQIKNRIRDSPGFLALVPGPGRLYLSPIVCPGSKLVSCTRSRFLLQGDQNEPYHM